MPAQHLLTNEFHVPDRMKAWVLGGPDEIFLVDKPVPQPAAAEVLVQIDAVAICATDLEIMRHGVPAMVEGGLPFHKNFTIGHEYMGTVVKLRPAVDEFGIGDRVTRRGPCRLRPLRALPAGHVHLVPQLWRRGKGASRQRLHDRWRASPNTPSTTSTRWSMCRTT